MHAFALHLPEPPPPKRAPLALVVRDPPVAGAEVDWSPWYLTDEEDMGSSFEHGESARIAQSSLAELRRVEAWPSSAVGSDQFFAWREDQPLVRVSPDVYVIDDPPPPPRPKSWQTWLPGHRPPRFALEIVSDDWAKDYEDNPPKYAQLGCLELAIFDPDAVTGAAGGDRVPLQIYRRAPDGVFALVYAGLGPAPSRELGVFLVARREGAVARLRFAFDVEGTRLVPTEAEAREAEARGREAEARGREAEARGREAAEARVRELEEKLRKLGG